MAVVNEVAFPGDSEMARRDVEFFRRKQFRQFIVRPAIELALVPFAVGVFGGIEPALALEVLTHSAIGSPMLQARAPMLLELPEQAWFDVAMMRKDLRLALAAARELGVPVPSTAVADELLAAASALGYEHRDIAVVFRVLSEETSPPRTAQPGHDTP